MSENNNLGQTDFLIEVSENLPTMEDCIKFVSQPSCGAISSFIGITRDNFNDKKVKELRYEAYVPMAKKVLFQLCHTAQATFKDVERIAMVHILGDCPVGRASVIICVASPHRRQSLDCVSFLIDELKANVPIWKLEVYEDDEEGSVWKENIEWKNGKCTRVMTKTVT